jgi:hypothetical protein
MAEGAQAQGAPTSAASDSTDSFACVFVASFVYVLLVVLSHNLETFSFFFFLFLSFFFCWLVFETGSYCVGQVSLELAILLSQPSEC